MRLDISIVLVIMPITNYQDLARFSEMCGAEIPRWIMKRMESFGDDSELIRTFGVGVVQILTNDLLVKGAPGLRFYCMNKFEPTELVWASK